MRWCAARGGKIKTVTTVKEQDYAERQFVCHPRRDRGDAMAARQAPSSSERRGTAAQGIDPDSL